MQWRVLKVSADCLRIGLDIETTQEEDIPFLLFIRYACLKFWRLPAQYDPSDASAEFIAHDRISRVRFSDFNSRRRDAGEENTIAVSSRLVG